MKLVFHAAVFSDMYIVSKRNRQTNKKHKIKLLSGIQATCHY